MVKSPGYRDFGALLGSHLFSGFQRSPFDPCLNSVSSFYEHWRHAAIMSSVPSVQCESSRSQGLQQVRYSMSSSRTGDRMRDGFMFASAGRLYEAFRFENDNHHRVAAKKVSKIDRGRSATSVHGLVIRPFELTQRSEA